MALHNPSDPLEPGNITGQNPATPERMPGHTAHVADAPIKHARELVGRPAFLFQTDELSAITLDSSGAILPSYGDADWRLAHYITLGHHDLGRVLDMDNDPIIQALSRDGYFVWRSHAASENSHDVVGQRPRSGTSDP